MEKKAIRELLDELARQGWRVDEIKKGWMVFPPRDGRAITTPVTIHKTPSDWRAWQNTLSELRRRGYEQKGGR